jgi:hypothetical protein
MIPKQKIVRDCLNNEDGELLYLFPSPEEVTIDGNYLKIFIELNQVIIRPQYFDLFPSLA